MKEDNEVGQKNNTTTMTKMLNQLNLPTLATILLMGGSNFFVTKTTSDDQRQDTLRAVREIHELHDALEAFEKRQKDLLEGQNNSLRNQTQMLSNQSSMLEHLKLKP